ncbi:hypothetical protein [Arsenophonus sp.]|uniref:hypothetical protein n=1 Tax=Arsenophonus sp. TaxID=1872640 RepID=UPI00387A3032
MHNQYLKESIYALLPLGYLVIAFPPQLTLFIQAPQRGAFFGITILRYGTKKEGTTRWLIRCIFET